MKRYRVEVCVSIPQYPDCDDYNFDAAVYKNAPFQFISQALKEAKKSVDKDWYASPRIYEETKDDYAPYLDTWTPFQFKEVYGDGVSEWMDC